MSTVSMPASNPGRVGANPTEATINIEKGASKWNLFPRLSSVLRNLFVSDDTIVLTGNLPVNTGTIITEIKEMSHKYLKIKIKSLAAEATMIRQEENKTKAQYRRLKGIQGREDAYDTQVATFWGLRHHRTGPVRSEARAAQLAYAYVRGKSFKFVENTTWIGWWSEKDNKAFLVPDMEYYVGRVARLAVKYGPVGTTDDEDVMKENIRSWMLADWTKERDTYFRDRQAKALQKIAARTKAREARKAA